MVYLKNKKIGIWGLGLVGKSVINFLSNQQTHHIQVMDKKKLSPEEEEFLHSKRCSFVTQQDPDTFITKHDLIIASPGVDIRPYKQYAYKFLTELDLIQNFCTKPILAITGSLAKTTVTHTLSTILGQKKRVLAGGNIGIPMLDLVNQQEHMHYLILEVSSFQLEWTRTFAPQLAIWTNFYPNHLDRHNSAAEYFQAKYNVLASQKEHHQALIPLSIAKQVIAYKPKSSLAFFSENKPLSIKDFHNHQLFWIEDNYIIHYKNSISTPLYPLNQLPSYGFLYNWLIIAAALKLLNLPLSLLQLPSFASALEHRLEFCGSINSIYFYNDSKATIMESTLAAVQALFGKPIILLLGGLSKGINRQIYVAMLKDKIKLIISFGKEAQQLTQWAQQENIACYAATTMEQAFEQAIDHAQANDQVLLSPGGSSFDLFKDYQERGNRFKDLVQNFSNKENIKN